MTNLNNPFRRCRLHLESDPRGGQQLGGGIRGMKRKLMKDGPRYAEICEIQQQIAIVTELFRRFFPFCYFLLSCQRPQVVHVLQSRNDRQWSAAEFNRRMNHGRKESARIAPLVRCMASLGAEDWHCPKKGHNSAQAPELVLRPVFFCIGPVFCFVFWFVFCEPEWMRPNTFQYHVVIPFTLLSFGEFRCLSANAGIWCRMFARRSSIPLWRTLTKGGSTARRELHVLGSYDVRTAHLLATQSSFTCWNRRMPRTIQVELPFYAWELWLDQAGLGCCFRCIRQILDIQGGIGACTSDRPCG